MRGGVSITTHDCTDYDDRRKVYKAKSDFWNVASPLRDTRTPRDGVVKTPLPPRGGFGLKNCSAGINSSCYGGVLFRSWSVRRTGDFFALLPLLEGE